MPAQKPTRPPTLLERWKNHPTRRAEFAALLQEPCMQDAVAICREQTFKPQPIPPGTPDIIAYTALSASVREGYLELLTNFLALANISAFRATERKAWETVDRDAAIEQMRRDEFGSSPPPEAPALTVPPAVNPSPES